MGFNKGYELKKFEVRWEKLRVEYAAAGMTEEAIQQMYRYDRQTFNVERTYIERTQELANLSLGMTVKIVIGLCCPTARDTHPNRTEGFC